MNRRGFLGLLAGLPIVGRLVAKEAHAATTTRKLWLVSHAGTVMLPDGWTAEWKSSDTEGTIFECETDRNGVVLYGMAGAVRVLHTWQVRSPWGAHGTVTCRRLLDSVGRDVPGPPRQAEYRPRDDRPLTIVNATTRPRSIYCEYSLDPGEAFEMPPGFVREITAPDAGIHMECTSGTITLTHQREAGLT